jgi:nucleotide-binding universal stress UspA family protein
MKSIDDPMADEGRQMVYKDLLVMLDSGVRSRERLQLAARLAERCAAHLVGLFVRGEIDRQGAGARRLFEDIAARHALSAEWRSAQGDPTELAAVHGRYADLIILGQIDPDAFATIAAQPFPEEVALLTGRPLLVIPYAGTFRAIGRRVLVGWDASRAATRAVHDAIPLLIDAESVTVLTIDAKVGENGHGELPGADIALHLARHGVTATTERTVSGDIGIANVLLSRASDLAVDLLVIGAYGHSHLRELLLGGTTRTVLASMTVPVLMSH